GQEMIKLLGELEVPVELLDKLDARGPGEHNSFVAGVDIPKVFAEFADKHGYEIRENGKALMFSSHTGVRLHADEMPSLIWVLCGTDCADDGQTGNKSHELICDGIAHHLDNGKVYYVDTSLPHAVVATNHELWAVISMYVSKEA